MGIPPFDPKAFCKKCGNSIPDPEAPTKQGPDGNMMITGPAPPPTPPNVMFCNGDPSECQWIEDGETVAEHMHQFCDVCSHEWLSAPLDWQDA